MLRDAGAHTTTATRSEHGSPAGVNERCGVGIAGKNGGNGGSLAGRPPTAASRPSPPTGCRVRADDEVAAAVRNDEPEL